MAVSLGGSDHRPDERQREIIGKLWRLEAEGGIRRRQRNRLGCTRLRLRRCLRRLPRLVILVGEISQARDSRDTADPASLRPVLVPRMAAAIPAVFRGLFLAMSVTCPAHPEADPDLPLPERPGTCDPRNWSRSFFASNIDISYRLNFEWEIGTKTRENNFPASSITKLSERSGEKSR